MAETVEALSDAFLEHYTHIGKPLSIPTQSMDQIMFGYFCVNDLCQTISCKFDIRGQKAEIDFSYAEKRLLSITVSRWVRALSPR